MPTQMDLGIKMAGRIRQSAQAMYLTRTHQAGNEDKLKNNSKYIKLKTLRFMATSKFEPAAQWFKHGNEAKNIKPRLQVKAITRSEGKK